MYFWIMSNRTSEDYIVKSTSLRKAKKVLRKNGVCTLGKDLCLVAVEKNVQNIALNVVVFQ